MHANNMNSTHNRIQKFRGYLGNSIEFGPPLLLLGFRLTLYYLLLNVIFTYVFSFFIMRELK